MKMTFRFVLPVLCAWFCHANAAFVLVDDFESLPISTLNNGDNNWVVGGASEIGNREYNVVDDSGNTVLDAFSYDNDSYGQFCASQPLSIANGSVGTLYMEFKQNTGTPDLTFGALTGSASNTTDIAGQTATKFRINNLSLQVDTGSWTTVGTIESDTWYSLWMVVDNSANNWNVYLQGGSGAYSSQTQLGSGDYGFNSSATNGSAPITYVGIRMNNSHSYDEPSVQDSANDSVYFDNFYVDESGMNLAAIPEPSSLLLVGLALTVLAGTRRIRR